MPSSPKLGLFSGWFIKAIISSLLTMMAALTACTTRPINHEWLVVKAPFLDIRTGPGRGYPITHSVLRGERIELLYQRTGYYKVRTPENIEGWTEAAPLIDSKSVQPAPVDR